MKKIIRLTENDLTRIVKRVISEQESNYWEDEVKKFAQEIAKKLNGKQISASEAKYDGSTVIGSYNGYFVRGLNSWINPNRTTSPYLIPHINLSLKVEYFDKKTNKLTPGLLSVDINLKNGYPDSVLMAFVHKPNAESLVVKEVEEDVIPPIKGIRIQKPENPCFKGYTWGKVDYMRIPKHFEGQAFTKNNPDGSKTYLFKQGRDWTRGTGVIDKGEGYPKKQEIYWFCSSGKLTITNKIPTRD